MWTRLAPLFVLVVGGAASAAVGCSVGAPFDSAGSAATQVAFNKNHALDDAALLDGNAVTAAQIQALLEAYKSPLATYHEQGGAAASKLIADAASKAGVNPIELLVRAQLEYALVGSTAAPPASAPTDDASVDPASTDDASADPASTDDAGASAPASDASAGPSDRQGDPMMIERIRQAFNCGTTATFAAQAACAASSVAHTMKTLAAGQPAFGGWKRGVKMVTQDKVTVIPDDAATAALYVYTPYVGEKGGGAKGIAGVSGHMDVWGRYAKALRYDGPTCAGKNALNGCSGTCAKDSECGGAASGRICDLGTQSCIDGCRGNGNGCPSPQTCSSTDDSAGACSAGDGGFDDDASFEPLDAGAAPTKDAGGVKDADSAPADPNADDTGDDQGNGHATASDNGDPAGAPFGASGEDDAGNGNTGAPAKKGGCSAAGTGAGDAGSFGLALGLAAALTASRSRKKGRR